MKTKICLMFALMFVIVSSNFTFLANDAPGQITIELNCLPNAPFTITKAKATPDIVSIGSHMTFRGAGSFNKDTNVQKLRIFTKINGNTAQDIKVALPNAGVQKKDELFIFTYDDNVPAIAPAGNYESFMYLLNELDKEVSCLKGSFTLN